MWWYSRVPTGFLARPRTRATSSSSVQLPDAASQQRTREVTERDRRASCRDATASTAGSRSAACRCSTSSAASNTGTLFVTFKPWDERLAKGLTLDAMLGQSAQAVRRRFRRRSSSPFRRRRFAASASAAGSRCRSRTAAAWAAARSPGVNEIVDDAKCAVAAAGGQHHVPPRRAADLRRHRPRKGEAARRAARRRVRDAAGVSGLGLRERLQQIRPHVPGARAGRAAVSGRARRHRAARSAQPHGQMVPLGTLPTVDESFGPQIINRYNLYPSAVDHRRAGARRTAPARRSS